MLFQIISNKSTLNMILAQIEYAALLAGILAVAISVVTIMMALEGYFACWMIWQMIHDHFHTIHTLLSELWCLKSKVTCPSSLVAAVYKTRFEFAGKINDFPLFVREDAMHPFVGIIINQDRQHLRCCQSFIVNSSERNRKKSEQAIGFNDNTPYNVAHPTAVNRTI